MYSKKMTKFAHTSLSVSDLKKSQAFYETVFDMKVVSEGERPELGIKFINLKNAGGSSVELIQHQNPLPLKEDLMDFQKVGIKHIAFAVDNIENILDKARKHGAKILWPIQKGVTVKRLAFIADPDGIPIELVEI